jgi:hypothetical protein
MLKSTTDIAFTPTVKAIQARLGSRTVYARLEQRGGWQDRITPELAAFIADRDSAYLATANAAGQPYIQHRGGPKGFLRVLDERTLGLADYGGNRQYITAGNLSENDRAFLFLMNYERRQRIKIWGRASAVEGDAGLQSRLMPPGYKATVERVILFRIEAWDVNCPQHIPPLIPAAEVARRAENYEVRIAQLEAALAQLQRDGHRSG